MEELPFESDPASVGLSDIETAHAIASALSYLLCRTKDRKLRMNNNLCVAIVGFARVELRDSPAFDRGFGADGGVRRPSGEHALKRLGLTHKDLKVHWQALRNRFGWDAALPPEILTAFVPKELWPVIASVLAAGPASSTEKFEAWLRTERDRVIPPNRARPQGGYLSQGHLDGLLKGATQLMDAFIELNSRQHSSRDKVLSAWVNRPRLEVEPARERHTTDTSAVPLQVLRQAWSQLASEIEKIVRGSLDEEAELIPALNERQKQHLFVRIRKRALLALLASVGMRIDALERLDVEDFVPRHTSPGGFVGPALALRPGKSIPQTEVHYKPLPIGVGRCLSSWLALREVLTGEAVRPTDPLFCSTIKGPRQRWTYASMRDALAGSKRRRYEYKGEIRTHDARALLPKNGDPSHGYTAHTVRSAVVQMIRSKKAADWLEENRDELLLEAVSAADALFQVLVAEALIDHQMPTFDPLGYGGGKKKEDREYLSRIGTAICWALLTTDAGARKVRNADRFRAAVHKRQALETELVRIDGERTTVFAELGLNPRPSTIPGGLLNLQRLTEREKRVNAERDEVKEEIDALRNDPHRMVVVPDDSDLPQVDLAAIEREVLDGVEPHNRRRLKPVREWLTITEFAAVTGIGLATARRWAEGRLRRRARVQPWDPANPPICQTLGRKRRRIKVSAVNPALFDTEEKRVRLAETLARLPEGWSEELAATPLTV